MRVIHILPYCTFRYGLLLSKCVCVLYYKLSEDLNFMDDIQTEEKCRYDKTAMSTIKQSC